ncbi:MAG: type II toxin-antitoxin system RelE/ParE family toxin [Bdellovibrionales bacterium]
MRCTDEFSAWINELDRSLRIRIDQRIQRLIDGNPGFYRRFDNLLEIKWKTGTMGSFRLYCAEFDGMILLLGGHKDSQSKDILNAKALLEGIKNEKIRTQEYE